jgi:hypothetical protein
VRLEASLKQFEPEKGAEVDNTDYMWKHKRRWGGFGVHLMAKHAFGSFLILIFL